MATLTIRRPASRFNATTGLRARVAKWVIAGMARHKMRTALGKLDDVHLLDIGVSREAAQIEMQKPFWRA
jgi:uncharacterized protein YjiS (DUF1127 family)